MRADRLLADNLLALLNDRRLKQKELAVWCRHSEVWVSQLLRNERSVTVKDLDRIADFFGLQPYQLFQPGVHGVAERRKHNRRSGRDRRIQLPARLARDLEASVRPPAKEQIAHEGPATAQEEAIRALVADFEMRVARLLAKAGPGGQVTTTRRRIPDKAQSHRAPR